MEIYKPKGLKFYDKASNREMLFVQEGWAKGWICFKQPDGQWVTLRKATKDDKIKLSLPSEEGVPR